MARRKEKEEILLRWEGQPPEDAVWVDEDWFKREYPHLEVKGFEGEGSCNQPEPPQEPPQTQETLTDDKQDETGPSLQALDSNITDQMAPERHKPAKEEIKCQRGRSDEKKDEIPGRLRLNDKAAEVASPASFTIKEEKGQPRGSTDGAKDKQRGRPGCKDPDNAICH